MVQQENELEAIAFPGLVHYSSCYILVYWILALWKVGYKQLCSIVRFR